ncbi:MAG: CHAT domain-containing protein, partial [Crocinitomicaceae bacterium]|nr:CHAT domain-containing protein [Crocinitomicaceae bacterium]
MKIKLIKKRIKKIVFYVFIFYGVLISIILTQLSALGQVDLGFIKQLYQQEQYGEIIEQLAPYENSNNPLIQEYLASSYETKGQLNLAIFHWIKARQLYEQQQNEKKVTQLKLVQAQLEIEVGNPQKALLLLQKMPISGSTLALGGNALLVWGEYEQAIASFEAALKQPLKPGITLSLLSNLSQAYEKNTLRLKQKQQLLRNDGAEKQRLEVEIIDNETRAKATANQAWQLAQTFNQPNYNTIRAWLTWLPYLSPEQQAETLTNIKTALKKLPPTHQTVVLWLNLANIIDEEESITEANNIADTLNDYQSMAIAKRQLGHYFESQQQYPLALAYTQEAIKYAHAQLAYEQLYRASWQEARIYEAIGEKESAQLAYEQAVYSLNRIRNKLIAASRDIQFDFQQEVEPVYRNYLSLLLENPTQKNLDTVTQVFDFLQLSRLENLFQDNCFEESDRNIEPSKILEQKQIAVINTIILPNSLHIIIRLPQGEKYHIQQNITSQILNQKIEEWKKDLFQVTTNNYLNSSQYFYDLLISPFEDKLNKFQVKQLLFINDGLLKNLPMSALYDSKRQEFLIEKYPISNNLGEKFITNSPKLQSPVIAFGLAESRPPINQSLPNVTNELQEIKNIWGGNTYLDQEFTKEGFIEILKTQRPQILHIATHGIFTGVSETTYLQSYDQII